MWMSLLCAGGQGRAEERIEGPAINLLVFSSRTALVASGIAPILGQNFSARIETFTAEMPSGVESKKTSDPVRYSAVSFLEHMRGVRQDGVMLALTDAPLYYPGFSRVFGLSQPSYGVSVVSVAFFGSREGDLCERAVKTATHELGHLYGLAHCTDPFCAMFFSYGLSDTDRKLARFCPGCEEKLSINLERRHMTWLER